MDVRCVYYNTVSWDHGSLCLDCWSCSNLGLGSDKLHILIETKYVAGCLSSKLILLFPSPNQENQVVHDVQQYKVKPAENGQPEHKTQLEEISLALGWLYTFYYMCIRAAAINCSDNWLTFCRVFCLRFSDFCLLNKRICCIFFIIKW